MSQSEIGLLSRIRRGSADRKTRFHTARGDRMPASAWRSLPTLLRLRLTGGYRDTPWIVPTAVSWLDRHLPAGSKVLELGSGYSTAWFSRRAEVVSFEDDPEWLQQLGPLVSPGAQIELVPLAALLDAVGAMPDGAFDLVVDGNESDSLSRLDCVAATRSKVKPGGLLLLDDSDRPGYRRADALLEGWPVIRFIGPKPRPLTTFETSIYRRPAAL